MIFETLYDQSEIRLYRFGCETTTTEYSSYELRTDLKIFPNPTSGNLYLDQQTDNVFVEVYATDIKGHNPRRSNSAYYTFVALDQENGKPIPVPPVIPVTEIEQQRFDSAPRRREMRLILAGRLKPENAHEVRALFEEIIHKEPVSIRKGMRMVLAFLFFYNLSGFG